MVHAHDEIDQRELALRKLRHNARYATRLHITVQKFHASERAWLVEVEKVNRDRESYKYL